jgi:hypothetical protein
VGPAGYRDHQINRDDITLRLANMDFRAETYISTVTVCPVWVATVDVRPQHIACQQEGTPSELVLP